MFAKQSVLSIFLTAAVFAAEISDFNERFFDLDEEFDLQGKGTCGLNTFSCGVEDESLHLAGCDGCCCMAGFKQILGRCECTPETEATNQDGACFPGDSIALRLTPNNRHSPVSIESLSIGDRVACVQADGSFGFCTVYAFATVDTSLIKFHEISTKNKKFTSTPHHNIYVLNGFDPSTTFAKLPLNGVYKQAKDVLVGEQLVHFNAKKHRFELEQVISTGKTIVKAGAFDPQVVGANNDGGRIIVDGLVASHNSGTLCTGSDDKQRMCMLRDAHRFLVQGRTRATQVPATLWGSTPEHPVVHDPWVTVRDELDREETVAGFQLDLAAYSATISGLIADGQSMSEEIIYSALITSYVPAGTL